jgi:predicted dehydrogenase
MRPTRRDFLRMAAATGVAARTTTHLRAQDAPASQTVAPNDRIQLATIGCGIQGIGDTSAALDVPGVELVAVADVYEGRLTRAKEDWGDHLFTTRDYREILTRPDVDAVIIATPDHWHAQIATDAMKAGKDVYVEKPMVQDLDEGPRLIAVEQDTKRILQVGSQRVSGLVYAKARELFRAGSIGELNLVEAWINRNSAIGAWQYSLPSDASPQTIDWDRFLGNAPKRPFEPIRLFRWRNYRDYGTGIPGDLFVHLFSGIHFVLDSIGPTRVMATGALSYWKDGRDVPDLMVAIYDYPKTATHPEFKLVLKVNFADGGGENQAFRFVGADGVLTIGGGAVTLSRRHRSKEPGHTADTFAKAMEDAFVAEYRAKFPDQRELRQANEEVFQSPQGYKGDSYEHFRVFFDAVRSRKPVVEDATFGLRAGGPAVLANHSYWENRPIGWDPERMKRTNSRTND